MGVEAKANPIQVSGSNQRCIPGSVRFFSIFFTLRLLQHWGGHIIRQMASLRASISEELVQHHRYALATDYLHTSLNLDPSHAER